MVKKKRKTSMPREFFEKDDAMKPLIPLRKAKAQHPIASATKSEETKNVIPKGKEKV
jgi:hypothetical protein